MSKKHYSTLLIFSIIFLLLLSLTISSADKDEYYKNKFKEKIEVQLARTPKISLTVNRQSTTQKTTLTGTATNSSSDPLTHLVINGMLITDKGKTGSHYQVIDIFEEQKVSLSLSPGESRTFTFQIDDISWSTAKVQAVIFVQETQSPNKEIYQAILVK